MVYFFFYSARDLSLTGISKPCAVCARRQPLSSISAPQQQQQPQAQQAGPAQSSAPGTSQQVRPSPVFLLRHAHQPPSATHPLHSRRMLHKRNLPDHTICSPVAGREHVMAGISHHEHDALHILRPKWLDLGCIVGGLCHGIPLKTDVNHMACT